MTRFIEVKRRCRGIRRPLALLWPVALLLLFMRCGTANAQQIRRVHQGFASLRREADEAATAQNRFDWPRVTSGETGTQVHLSFDVGNADITIISSHEITLPTLLQEAQRITGRLGQPRANYNLFSGSMTTNVDIDLNAYLRRAGWRHTAFDLELGALAAALKASTVLPKPVVLFIHGTGADSVDLIGADTRTLGPATFLGLDQIPANARLNFAVSLPWYFLIVAGLLAILFTALPLLVIASPWIVYRSLIRQEEQRTKKESVPDPAEVQARYNRQRPVWMSLLLPAAFPALLLFAVSHKSIGAWNARLPSAYQDGFTHLAPLFFSAMFPLLALSYGVSRWTIRRRRQQKGSAANADAISTTDSADEIPEQTLPARRSGHVFLYLIPMAALMPALLLATPLLARLPLEGRFAVIFTVMVLSAVCAVLGMINTGRSQRTELGPDSPWYPIVHEMAAQAGVRVRHVVQIESRVINAYASLLGTVGLTTALLHKMTSEEVRAVIAHELGHLKAGHVRKNLMVGIPAVLAVYGGWLFGVMHWTHGRVSPEVEIFLRSPAALVLLNLPFALLTGRGKRAREEEADRFAVEMTGDPELVVQTLRKLHTLNASPHHLKPSDEALSAHPSLANRIEAIRRLAPPSDWGQETPHKGT